MINSSLPLPSTALLGVINTRLTQGAYRYLQTGNNFIVFRNVQQKLVIEYDDATRYAFDNQCSAIFENNTHLTESGLLIWLYKQGNGLYLKIFNTLTRQVVRSEYITQEAGFASIAIDRFLSRVIIYKSVVAAGSFGHSFIYAYTWTSNQLVAYHDSTIEVSPDTVVYFAFKENAPGYYRSIKTNSVSKIDHIFHGSLSNQEYYATPLAGSNLVANTSDLYLPAYSGTVDAVFVLNASMTQISAWSPATPNTQILSPVTIDGRSGLFHAQGAPTGYPRLLLDTNTQILYDTVTYGRFRLQTPNIITSVIEYPVCESGDLDAYSTLPTTDRQSGFIISASSSVAAISEQVFNLNSTSACPLVRSSKQSLHLSFPKVVSTNLINPSKTGLLAESITVTGDVEYFDNDATITSSGNVFRFYRSGILIGSATLTANKVGIIRIANNLIILRSGSSYVKFTDVAVSIVTGSVNLVGPCYDAFLWNNIAYFRFANGISLIKDPETNAGPIDYAVAYTRSDFVRLSPNLVTNELWLFDSGFPNIVRRVNINLSNEDLTNISTQNLYTEILSNELTSTAPTASFAFRVISETDFILINQSTPFSVQVIENLQTTLTATANSSQVSRLTGLDIKIFDNNLLAIDFLSGIFLLNLERLQYVDDSQINIANNLAANFVSLIQPTTRHIWGAKNNQLTLEFNKNLYTGFTEFGRFYNPSNDILFSSTSAIHAFAIVYSASQDSVAVNFVEPDSVKKSLIQDYEVKVANSVSQIDAPGYTGKHFEYNVEYILPEAETSLLLKAFYLQATRMVESTRFRIYFKDFYSDENGVGEAIIKNCSYEWHSKDRYKVQLAFEVVN
jgi:hypothetical protein